MSEVKKENNREIVRSRFNFGRLFLGLVIIAIGALYLLRNFGVIDFDLDWSRLWPLIIIFIGLSMLSGRSTVAVIIGALATLIVVAVLVSAVITGKTGIPDDRVTNTSRTEQAISIGKSPGISRAEIDVKMGAGKLNIDGGSSDLVSGNFASQFLRLDTQNTITSDVQRVKLVGEGTTRPFGRQFNELDLSLNSVVPMMLTLDTGAMDMRIDLSGVKAEEININTGASSLNLVMGEEVDRARVTIKAGASSINIEVPENVGARIEIDSGLSSKNFEGFKQIDSDTYETDDYATALRKIDFEFNIGASSLDISRR
ncbi:MAG: DUF5668 domain-containing protein [Patescibacteria group bacterium]|jgi:HSP20 family molecular chaperone IbpA